MKLLWFLQASELEFGSQETRDLTRRPRWILWWTLISLIIFVAWANWAEIDQITRAPGTVIASSKTQTIQSQEGGVLDNLLVSEGDRVSKGDVLGYLARTQSESSYRETQAKKAALLATRSRLRAEVYGIDFDDSVSVQGYPEFVINQKSLYFKRQAALTEQVNSLENMTGLIKQELDLNRPLIKTGDVSRAEILGLERQLLDLQSQAAAVTNEFLKGAQSELALVEEELASVEQILMQREDRLSQTTLLAPTNGIVKNIKINTSGGVIRPGEAILQIVPVDDALVIEARVSPAEIAFLKEGLGSTVKIDAYDYTIYGDLEGILIYISADTLSEELQNGEAPYYRIQVQTTENRFKGSLSDKLEILPGMTATVEVKTGSNTVLHYLTKPLVKTLSESLSER